MFRRTLLMSAAAATIALGVTGWSKAIASNEAGADIVDTAVAEIGRASCRERV